VSDAATATYWDVRYAHPNHVFGYRPNDFLRQEARFLRPRSRVLALCDGEGRNGVWLAEQGHDVVSLDFSAVGLAKAEARCASTRPSRRPNRRWAAGAPRIRTCW